MHVQSEDNYQGTTSVLPPCGSLGSNSGHQAAGMTATSPPWSGFWHLKMTSGEYTIHLDNNQKNIWGDMFIMKDVGREEKVGMHEAVCRASMSSWRGHPQKLHIVYYSDLQMCVSVCVCVNMSLCICECV